MNFPITTVEYNIKYDLLNQSLQVSELLDKVAELKTLALEIESNTDANDPKLNAILQEAGIIINAVGALGTELLDIQFSIDGLSADAESRHTELSASLVSVTQSVAALDTKTSSAVNTLTAINNGISGLAAELVDLGTELNNLYTHIDELFSQSFGAADRIQLGLAVTKSTEASTKLDAVSTQLNGNQAQLVAKVDSVQSDAQTLLGQIDQIRRADYAAFHRDLHSLTALRDLIIEVKNSSAKEEVLWAKKGTPVVEVGQSYTAVLTEADGVSSEFFKLMDFNVLRTSGGVSKFDVLLHEDSHNTFNVLYFKDADPDDNEIRLSMVKTFFNQDAPAAKKVYVTITPTAGTSGSEFSIEIRGTEMLR